MGSKSTQLSSLPRAQLHGPYQPIIIIEFTEDGWQVIEDTRKPDDKLTGYLHWYEDISANEITDAVRDQIIKYYYNHPRNLPGVGATPQKRYMQGLSIEERERIGNGGDAAYYVTHKG